MTALKTILPYLIELVRRDLSNAVDNLSRAKMQKVRMPYDHDNNDALVGYSDWRNQAEFALHVLENEKI